MEPSERRRRWWEIAAVVLTGGAFLVYENVLRAPKLPFLVAGTGGWGAYLLLRLRADPATRLEWGLRTDTLAPSTWACALVAAAGVLVVVAYRAFAGWVSLPATALLVVALYPFWAFVQQFAVQALVAANLVRLGVRTSVVVPLAAVLFGLAHLPDWPLVALCAAGGLAWTAIFLRFPNLVPIAVTHAFLGTLVYHWVLRRDPWTEMFPPR
jgi:hypothetical protein